MEWLRPAGAWALVALVPVIALYVLKKKTKPLACSSVLLWRRMEAESLRSKPFQRLKNQLLLWLQILIVVLLALGLMRPVSGGGSGGEAVFVFDLSLSMQTLDSQKVSRLERAQSQALALLDGMRETEALTVLAAGDSFEQTLSRSTDHAAARRAISALKAQNGGADLAGALSLAEAMRRDVPGLRVYVFTDDAQLLPGNATLCAVGEPMDNVSILDATLQPESGTAFARVQNRGAAREISLECEADGALCDVRTVTLEAGAQTGVRFAIPVDTEGVTVRLSQADALAADDIRYAVRQENAKRTALLVTQGNVFLERALALDERLEVDVAAPRDIGASAAYDLYVYDGCLPEEWPEDGAIWALNPSGAVGQLTPSDSAPVTAPLRAAAGEAAREITQHLLLSDIAIQTSRSMEGGVPVLTAGERVLMAVGEENGRRVAALGFDVHSSNLPLKADFPVLVQNLLAYLLPETASAVQNAVCGKPVAIHTDARAEEAFVLTPTARRAELAGGVLEDTGEIGVYTLVERFSGDARRETRFALHAPEAETDTESVAVSTQAEDEGRAQTGSREWTGAALLAALAILLLEWRVSRRGTGV